MTDTAEIRRGLNIGNDATVPQRTIDITTTGASSGEARRIEIWFHQIDGRWYITGSPPRPRSWYRNLQADPHLTVHLKHDVHADVEAEARLITDEDERRSVFERLLASIASIELPAGLPPFPPVEEWLAASPLVELSFADL